ncbi:MAG: PIN domain-containing protein [Gammaproteobacteria bacterium]|nr:PIN domain-containing protein [Gammaproteobacteria bacterium]
MRSPPAGRCSHLDSADDPTLRDANDEMVLEVATNGDADCVVTRNLKGFAAAIDIGVAVATPREVLRRLRT